MTFLRRQETPFWNQPHEPEPDELHLVEVNEFLPRIGKWMNVAGGVLVSIFVVAIVLTTVVKYKVTIKVPASVRPVGELRVVQSAMAGTIQRIDARENQVMAQGEAIAYVDNLNLKSQKSQLENSIQKIKLQLNQIKAQEAEIDAQIIAQTNLMNRTIIAAQAQLKGSQRNFEDQQIKATTDLTQAEIALKFSSLQLERLQREKLLTATVQEAETALQLAKIQRDRLQSVAKSGAISRNLVEEKEQAVQSAQAKLEQAKANAKNLLEEKEQSLKVAQINLQKAKSAMNPHNAAVTVAYEQIKQEQAKGEATLAALRKEKEIQIQQRLEVQKQLVRTLQELEQVETELKKSVIRAPITGTLLKLNLRNPGQVVQLSDAIAQIAPLNSSMQIKAHVMTKDIDKVKPGQQVQMQVSACPYPDYGILKGSVSAVAPDALPTVKNGANANEPQSVTYEVTIQPQSSYLGKGDRLCYLKSGMEGRANIITRQETVLQFILRKARLTADI